MNCILLRPCCLGYNILKFNDNVLYKYVCFPEDDGDLIREEFLLGPVDRLGGLVVIAPAHRAGDPVRILVQARIFL